MGATEIYGFRWPERTGVDPDGPQAIQDLAEDVEGVLSSSSVLSYTPAWTAQGSGSVQPSGAYTITGRYQVDRGVCSFSIVLLYGSTVNGGRGNLRFSLPLQANVDLSEQYVLARHSGLSGRYWPGMGIIFASEPNVVRPMFPQSLAGPVMNYWRDKTSAGTPGQSIPPGSSTEYIVANGGRCVVSGTYFV